MRDVLTVGGLVSLAVGVVTAFIHGGDVLLSALLGYPELFLGFTMQIDTIVAAAPVEVPFLDVASQVAMIALLVLTALKIGGIIRSKINAN